MAYIIGTAVSFTALRDNIIAGCVANGWSNSGNIIWKGSNYFELTIETNYIRIHGGTNQSGGVLTDKSTPGARLGGSYVTFPVTYELYIFDNPNEVYCVVNYNVDYYQQLSFGGSSIQGVGNGSWFTAAHNTTYISDNNGCNVAVYMDSIKGDAYATECTNSVGLFIDGSWSMHVSASFVHTSAVGTPQWRGFGTGSDGRYLAASSASLVSGLLMCQPSTMNNTTVLLPIKSMLDVGSYGRASVISLNNARFCRLDYLQPGDVITYGLDKWKVYPWLRRNSSVRNGLDVANPPNHTGTFGYAIKYEGA